MTRRQARGLFRTLTIFVALAAFVSVQVVPVHAYAKKRKRGFIEILSTTLGAEVYIDGQLKGVVPIEGRIGLGAGKHVISVRLRGYLTHEETVRVRSGRTAELEIDLIAVDGIVQITTPGVIDATIRVDGEIIGSTPFDGAIPAGDHSLAISRPGYETDIRDLRVQAGRTYGIDVPLQRIATEFDEVSVPVVAAPEEAFSGEPFYDSWWFWTLAGVAVSAGTAAGIVFGVGLEKEVDAPFDHRVVLP